MQQWQIVYIIWCYTNGNNIIITSCFSFYWLILNNNFNVTIIVSAASSCIFIQSFFFTGSINTIDYYTSPYNRKNTILQHNSKSYLPPSPHNHHHFKSPPQYLRYLLLPPNYHTHAQSLYIITIIPTNPFIHCFLQ